MSKRDEQDQKERELRAWLTAIAILAAEVERCNRFFVPDASGVRCLTCGRRWTEHLFWLEGERCPA